MSEFIERFVEKVEIHKLVGNFRVVCYGEGRTRIKTERFIDVVKVHGGCVTTMSGIRNITDVDPIGTSLFFREEVLAESGARILHISGG